MVYPKARAPRRMAMLKAKMADDCRWVDVILGNISTSGFMAKGTLIPAVGEHVHVQHRGVALKGEVVWTTRTRFGVRSFEPIDLSKLLAKSDLDIVSQIDTPRQRNPWWHWRDHR